MFQNKKYYSVGDFLFENKTAQYKCARPPVEDRGKNAIISSASCINIIQRVYIIIMQVVSVQVTENYLLYISQMLKSCFSVY